MMETSMIYCEKKKDNLELYLNDVYKKECEFKIEKEEIEFIQTGIETLVQDLVDLMVDNWSFDQIVSEEIDTRKTDLKFDRIVEIYFPIKSDCSLKRYVAENASQIKHVKSTIIKVGSFYDGTKNNFPDEFDFIIPILGVREINFYPSLARRTLGLREVSYRLQSFIYNAINRYGQSLCYPSMSEGLQETRKLYGGTLRSQPECGVSEKMMLRYINGLGKERRIYVDLVPAYRIIDCDKIQLFEEEVRRYANPETFRKEILSARNSLQIGFSLAFTEVEQHFMKNILSKEHVKVYRILKYLLNGNTGSKYGINAADLLERGKFINRYEDAMYTSYRIKTLMIYHHDSCTNTSTEDLGPCVLQVLEEMSKYESTDKFPWLFDNTWHLVYPLSFLKVLPFLETRISTFQSMQISEKDYDYKRIPLKPVTNTFLHWYSNIQPKLDKIFAEFNERKLRSESGQNIDRETKQDQTSEDSTDKDKLLRLFEQCLNRKYRQDQLFEESNERDKRKSESRQDMDSETRQNQTSKDSNEIDKIKSALDQHLEMETRRCCVIL